MYMPNIKEKLVYNKSRNEKGRMNGDATGGFETKLRRIDRLHMSTGIHIRVKVNRRDASIAKKG